MMPSDAQLDTPPHRDRSLALTAVVLIAVAFIGRAVYVHAPVTSDSAMFVYMGKLVANGGRMGVDLIDNKLPSVGLLMSSPYRLLGANWSAYALLGMTMSFAAVLILGRAAARCLGESARWPVMIAAAVWFNFAPAVSGQFQLETIVIFFTSIAGAATLELLSKHDGRDAFLAGLSIGTAMWAKPTAAAMLPAIILAIASSTHWPWRRRMVAIASISVGVAIPLAVCAWLLIATNMAAPLPATIAQLREYASNSSADVIDLLKPVVVLAIVLLPVFTLGWIFRRDSLTHRPTDDFRTPSLGTLGEGGGEGSADSRKHHSVSRASEFTSRGRLTNPQSASANKRTLTLPAPGVTGEGHTHARRAITILILTWLLLELLAVVAQRRMYAYHFIVITPPAAFLVGLLRRAVRVRSLVFAFGPPIATSLIFAWPVAFSGGPINRQARVITYLAAHAAANDAAWMDDDARLLTETDLHPGSRVPLLFLFANSDQTPARLSRQIIDDFQARQPRYIVLAQDPGRLIDLYAHHMVETARYPARAAAFAIAIRDIQRYVESNYQQEKTIDGMVVWRRNAPTETRVPTGE